MTTQARIRTNNVPRFLSSFGELPKEAQVEYQKDARDREDAWFFSYKGNWYCMDDFLCLRNPIHCPWGQIEFPGWDGYDGSGMIIKYALDENGDQDPERVIVGWILL